MSKKDDKKQDDENPDYESSVDSDASDNEDRSEQLQKRINDALRTFDQRGDNTVDVSEIGSVFRSLRVNVAQADIKEITSQLVRESNDSVSFDYLMPRLFSAMLEEKFYPKGEAILEAAFRALEDNDPPLTRERLEQYMSTRGEPLSEAELKEMSGHLAIKRHGIVDYKSYIRDVMYAIQPGEHSKR
ncbi:EF-hand calcium-binding domain-containing protein 2 [Aphelenchoides avenae]|nr:EF-hand calcium-binding domain-containing protein 2 [Aphelenchus avenae]